MTIKETLARIEENTKYLTKGIDDIKDQQTSHSRRIRSLEVSRGWVHGVLYAIGTLDIAALGVYFGKGGH